MEKIYYSPKGFWKGLPAVEKLSKEAKVSKTQSLEFLKKQAVWQIYLPPPKKIIRPRFDASTKNEIHQADLLFLPHDTVSRKTYKYALTVVDIESRYKEAEPLTSKDSSEVAKVFGNIYKRKLNYPKLLQVDPGREFMGSVTQLMAEHNVSIRRAGKRSTETRLWLRGSTEHWLKDSLVISMQRNWKIRTNATENGSKDYRK